MELVPFLLFWLALLFAIPFAIVGSVRKKLMPLERQLELLRADIARCEKKLERLCEGTTEAE
jgi:hypothetical protein